MRFKLGVSLNKTTLLLGAAGIMVGLVLPHLPSDTLHAANLHGFKPGNIMSDAVMSKRNAMSLSDIQSFLDSKNPCNNTNIQFANRYPHLGFTIRDGKFVCMAQDTFHGETAAQIIWQASQDFSINPQVLIVLLEKEQSLITDTWPSSIQYRAATGFGCPDTAACDERYYGLRNQVRQAARLFREVLDGGWTNYPLGRNYIQYHPNAACGGTEVVIENLATSALYRYTPYQPNQAALNAGYGTGNGCSAYGNRNFYALFTDWFGATSGVSWEAMSQPRWMEIKETAQKRNIITQKSVDGLLYKKRQIRFTSKTSINGVTYLRSEWDESHAYDKGIAIGLLQEIPFTPIKQPRWMPITCSTVKKIVPATGQIDKEVTLRAGSIAHFTTKITVNGMTYVRTDAEAVANSMLAIPIDCIDTAKNTNTPSFDTPRKLYIPAGTPFVDIRTQKTTTLRKNTSFEFGRKFTFNNTLYYQTTDDFKSDRLIGIASHLVREHIQFKPMDRPRTLTLQHDTHKTDLLTGATISQYIPAGTTRPFVDKYLLNGRWYLRTKTDYDNNSQLGIPLSLLK